MRASIFFFFCFTYESYCIPVPLDPATIAAGLATVGAGLMSTQTALDAARAQQLGPNRSLAVKFRNYLNVTLRSDGYYMDMGYAQHPPPPTVPGFTEDSIIFQKAMDIARGTAGVFGYQVEGDHVHGFLVAFTVPYNWHFSKNWMGLRCVKAPNRLANKTAFNNFYYHQGWKSREHIHDDALDFDYADSGRTLEIKCNKYKVRAIISEQLLAVATVSVEHYTANGKVLEHYPIPR